MAKKAVNKTAKKTAPECAGRRVSESKSKKPSTFDDVRQLVKLMIANGLSELDIEEGSRKIHLKRGWEDLSAEPVAKPAERDEPKVTEQQAPAAKEEFIEIKSPMVGTFYSSASPDSDDYVKVGDIVGGDDVVCIVEAMKVMNEIKAECSGTIAETCVKNAQPVEFGQVLYRVKPA